MSKRIGQEAEEEKSEPSAVMERLNWQLAYRDDARVGQALSAGEQIEEMHELSEAGLLDEFFVFVEEIGMMGVLEQMQLPGEQRVLVPTVQFVLLYLLKVLFGGQSMNELPQWLFSNVALMELVGFNAQQVEAGLTRRGDAQRKSKQKQGPLSPQCLADNSSKLSPEQMENLFNQMVKLVVGRGLLDGERIAALDGSKLPTPPSYEGCGKLKQTRSVKVKGQKERATEEYYVYGWKVLVLIDVHTRQPLAKRERVQVRERLVRHGHGKTATEERLCTELVGIEGLTTYDSYGDPEQTKSAHRRDYEGQPINAVVVRRWNNRTPAADGTVYLTNGPVSDPFVVFDHYDWRSVIENGIFKEGKHPWHLGSFPKKTEAAVIVHCYFTLLVMGLCTAYRLWQARSAAVPSEQTQTQADLHATLLGGEGTARWRLRLKEENRDKVIVFLGEAYGIFLLAELAVLSGLRLRRLPSSLGSRQDILQRYGIASEPSSG